MVEVDALGHFPSSDAQEDGAAAVAAGGTVGLESKRCLLTVGSFDQDQLVLPDLVKDALG